jgi:putative transposase
MFPWQVMLFLMSSFANRQQQAVIEYLTIENQILRQHVPKKRLLLSNAQRIQLAEKAKAIGRKGLASTQTLFTPDTLLRWHLELCAEHHTHDNASNKLGRPALSDEMVNTILMMARNNRSWGYDRIVGACANLGIEISATSVRNLLAEHGLEPAPERGKSPTWPEFIKSHMDVLAAVDFTTIDIWSGGRLKTMYLLFFMEIATRRMHFAGMTEHPNEIWMQQIARNVTDCEDGFLKGKKVLILDRDTKFPKSFKDALKREGIEPVLTPPRSPNCNAYIERFFRSIKSECLRRMIFFGEAMLRNAITKYIKHYHEHRKHQGLSNLRITPPPDEPTVGKIVCDEDLGGLLKYYRRAA